MVPLAGAPGSAGIVAASVGTIATAGVAVFEAPAAAAAVAAAAVVPGC